MTMRWWIAILLLLNALAMAWQWDAFNRWGWGPNVQREPERLTQQIQPEKLTFTLPSPLVPPAVPAAEPAASVLAPAASTTPPVPSTAPAAASTASVPSAVPPAQPEGSAAAKPAAN